MILRPVEDGDIPALVALWVAAWRVTMPEIDFARRADWLPDRLAGHRAAGVAVVCAVIDGAPVGFVTVDPASGHLDQLAVAPERFGAGVGAALLAEARRIAPAGLHLEVNQENPRAVRFYQREGFTIVGAGGIGAPPRPIWLMRWAPPA